MGMILYDLGNAAGQPMSPYCWRIREALHLLDIDFESRLLSLTGIRRQFTGPHKTVPVLSDGNREVGGSWEIAGYLAREHDPEGRLFGGPGGFFLASFVADWVDATVMGQVNRMIVKDVHDSLKPEDRAYFRAGQEKRQSASLEDLHSARHLVRPTFQASLYPVRRAIKQRPFLGGESPTYADFVLHATFQWSRAVSEFSLLRDDDRLHGWIQRMDAWLGA